MLALKTCTTAYLFSLHNCFETIIVHAALENITFYLQLFLVSRLELFQSPPA